MGVKLFRGDGHHREQGVQRNVGSLDFVDASSFRRGSHNL
jgi:hypothetical protein